MLKTTLVVVDVTFPGGIDSVDGVDEADAEVNGDTASYTRTANSPGQVTMTVTGDPTADRWIWFVGGAGVAAAGAGAYARRRRIS